MAVAMKQDLSAKVIKEHLEERAIKKDKDVLELYLSNKDLTECMDLARFKYLRCLWLNGNKIRKLSCLGQTFQLSELYLQNNHLVEIFGALQHLTCMQVLMLHNNQLTKLEQLVKEFNKMQNLKTLNLFNNPVAQEPDYRLFVIQAIPSVELLDRQEVLKSEKDEARKIYKQDQEKIRESVAFGRRSEGPPTLYYPASKDEAVVTKFDAREIGNNFLRNNPPYASEEDAVNARRLKKSITLFTTFDWSKVPRIEERRQTDTAFDSPEIITHVYR